MLTVAIFFFLNIVGDVIYCEKNSTTHETLTLIDEMG